MFNLKDNSIQIKLILIFTAIAIALSIAVGMLFFKKTKAIVISSKENELNTILSATSDKIGRFMFERYGDIQVMAKSPLLNKVSPNNYRLEFIENVRRAYKTYDYILITDSSGKIDVVAGDLKGDETYKQWLEYVLKGNIHVSDFIYSQVDKTHSLYFSAPIINDNGIITGAVIEKMNFSMINDIVKSVHPGKSGYAYLADEKGHIIPGEVQGNNMLDFKSKSPLNIVYDNALNISAFYPVSKYETQRDKWYLVVEEPVKEAFEVTYQLRNYILTAIIIYTIILLVFGMVMSKKIGESFNSLLTNLKSMMQQVLDISGEVASLSEIKQYAEKFINNIPGAVITMDNTYRITAFNKAASDIIGIDSQNIIGKSINVLADGAITPIIEVLTHGIENEIIYIKHIIKIKNTKGGEIELIINTSLQKASSGKLLGVVGVFRSIEEIRKIEDSVIRTKNLESLGALSAGMAHEIRNPLTSIKGYAQYIKTELGEDSELVNDIAVIIKEVDRLNGIIGRFLAFAKPEELKLELININDVIKSIVKLVEKELSSKNIKEYINLGDIPQSYMDFEQMEQAVLNLVLNSIQAMPQGGILEISTKFLIEANMIEIAILDTGMGIKPEFYNKIFEPFFTTSEKGTGLGLAISSRIIEEHKGLIEVQSALDKGTRFTIKLPIDI